MKIRAYYNEYIKPIKAEDVDGDVSYFEDNIPIMVEQLEKKELSKEIISGLKDTEYNLIIRVENDTFDKSRNDIKVKDRVVIYGKEYRVLEVKELIDNPKYAKKIARNNSLYNKYVKKIVVLK